MRREIGHGDGIAELLTAIWDLHRRAGDMDAARAVLDEAVTLCRDMERAAQLALAATLLACLPGGDSEAAMLALAEIGDTDDSPGLRWLLHQATGERVYLEQAKRLLDEQLAKVPEEYHDAMCTNLRVHREILAAWQQH